MKGKCFTLCSVHLKRFMYIQVGQYLCMWIWRREACAVWQYVKKKWLRARTKTATECLRPCFFCCNHGMISDCTLWVPEILDPGKIQSASSLTENHSEILVHDCWYLRTERYKLPSQFRWPCHLQMLELWQRRWRVARRVNCKFQYLLTEPDPQNG